MSDAARPAAIVTGTNFTNKGAELLGLAARDALVARGLRPVLPLGLGRLGKGRQQGFSRLLDLASRPELDRVAARLPGRALSPAGLVRLGDLRLVLDASGFLFSDQWGVDVVREGVKRVERLLADGRPLVLLPQAFGPFEDEQVRRLSTRLLERAALVCARDRVSLGHVEGLGLDVPVRLVPDVTLDWTPPPLLVSAPGRVLLVPNSRMVDRGGLGREDYLGLLTGLARDLGPLAPGGVALLVHEAGKGAKDPELVAELAARLGDDVAVLAPDDAGEIKAHLAAAALVVTSRFHALESALSSGVPALALGWSHKYAEALRDVGRPEWMVGLDDAAERVPALAAQLLADPGVRPALVTAVQPLKATVRAMWDEVAALV